MARDGGEAEGQVEEEVMDVDAICHEHFLGGGAVAREVHDWA
eukprot:CAMPEP_0174265164 /NCGR_PEP_ID=MMETSP0439-20130205/25463_1 /TAXON_ID=0 /ORGANISM="Stereomyxa ramosa, Strain Chinc5" /LENGTH=41 /DNA_ID= /DNA_START= /DNA_END= /DNA_ORIENTATION=